MGSMHMLAKEGARVLFSGQSLRVAQVWFSWTWQLDLVSAVVLGMAAIRVEGW